MGTLQRGFAHDVQQQAAQRTVRLGAVMALVALMLAAIAAAPVSAGPPVNCVNTQIQPQCIENVKITPHGTFADFSFFTTSAKIATVQVSWVAPKKLPDGTYSYSGLSTVAFAISSATNQHTVQISDLWAHATYHYLINAAKSQVGNDAQITGTFSTLSRHVDVTFTSIHVTDDSDSLGAGELTFFFSVNGWLQDFPSGDLTYPLQSAEIDVNSGETIALSGIYRGSVDNTNKVVLKVFGKDDDCEGFVPLPGYPTTLCTAGAGPYEDPPGGSNSDADWSTAITVVMIDKSGVNEEFKTNVNFATSADKLKFEVAATITVTYV